MLVTGAPPLDRFGGVGRPCRKTFLLLAPIASRSLRRLVEAVATEAVAMEAVVMEEAVATEEAVMAARHFYGICRLCTSSCRNTGLFRLRTVPPSSYSLCRRHFCGICRLCTSSCRNTGLFRLRTVPPSSYSLCRLPRRNEPAPAWRGQ